MLLPGRLEGIGWFTYEVFKRLVQKHPEVEWHFIFDRPFAPSSLFASGVEGHQIYPPARHPFLWYLWFEFSLPRLLRRIKPDLLISPDGFLSLGYRGKQLPVIHDINFEHQKQNTDRLAGAYFRYFFRRYAHKAARIATVSKYSLDDLAATYGLSPDKIDLVYNGVSDFFRPLGEEEALRVRQQRSDGSPYFVFIGALNPRKNIDGMLQAYALYRKQGGEARFVVVGDKMFWSTPLEKAYRSNPYREDIIFTGRLEGEELNLVLGAAQALCFVSHFEGFGIPILEAFRSEVPVITGTNSSLPEVAGEAAWLCDSRKPPEIAAAMLASDDAGERKRRIAMGRLQGQKFSWDRSADMLWSSILKTLGQDG